MCLCIVEDKYNLESIMFRECVKLKLGTPNLLMFINCGKEVPNAHFIILLLGREELAV